MEFKPSKHECEHKGVKDIKMVLGCARFGSTYTKTLLGQWKENPSRVKKKLELKSMKEDRKRVGVFKNEMLANEITKNVQLFLMTRS